MKLHYIILALMAAATAGCNRSEVIGGEDIVHGPESTDIAVEVLDYSPAPGQFVNVLPQWLEGMTAEDMCRAVEESLVQRREVTLGAWGGSLTVRLTTPILNLQGDNSFRVLGNAVTTGAEPGIVWVMEDANGNGQPDDGEWLLILPQGLDRAETVSVSYSAPAPDAPDERYIHWLCSDGSEGYINRVAEYHTQSFFPQWLSVNEMSFTGLRLRDNGWFDPERMMYILDPLSGTADSYPNSNVGSVLTLDNVVRRDGTPVHVDAIDFIKVVTGVLQANGPLGECSTEVRGFEKYKAKI